MKIKDGIKLGIGATIGYCITYGVAAGVYKILTIRCKKLIDIDLFNKAPASREYDERFHHKPENTIKVKKIGFAVD